MKAKLTFVVTIMLLGLVTNSWAANTGYVTASVGYGSGAGINAQQVPGLFTIPTGMKAVNLKYKFDNPSNGFHSETLGASNIYSVTRGAYATGPGGAAPTELPAGQYKFVVGGSPGASGSLSYTLTPN